MTQKNSVRKITVCIFVFAIVLCGNVFAGDDDVYIKKDSFVETMHASRAAYQAKCLYPGAPRIECRSWYRTRDITGDEYDEVFPYQTKIDLKLRGQNTTKVMWRERSRLKDRQIQEFNSGVNARNFLSRIIKADQNIKVQVSLGCNCEMSLWLNGKKLISSKGKKKAQKDQDFVELSLKKGDNHVVVKLKSDVSRRNFYFKLQDDRPLYDIWEQLNKDFTRESGYLINAMGTDQCLGWFVNDTGIDINNKLREIVLADFNGVALKRAITDLSKSFPDDYTNGKKYLRQVDEIVALIRNGDDISAAIAKANCLKRDVLMSNPLLDFDELLFVRRGSEELGLPNNWLVNSSLKPNRYNDEIAVLSPFSADGKITTLYKPAGGTFVGDVDLHFDADKMLFSMVGSNDSWQVWEMGIDGKDLTQVTPGKYDDVDNYDACYLPDGRIIFASTRQFQGVPCIGGKGDVANLFLLDRKDKSVRQLCYDQDQNWSPAILNNGRVLFTRWEYSDTPHYFSRLLFHMNPDGTDQKAYYGSNSYWPNSLFYAKPIPGHATQFIGIISGHHGVARMGELILFDAAKGRHEADGVVQRIPGYGKKVEPVIADTLVDESWPKFLHPYPLNDKYFIVSCQPSVESQWGIYLVDVFDNMTLIKEEAGNALFEPLPIRKTQTPPVIADRVNLKTDQSTVLISDVYEGPGLKGVPRGTVKKLRLYELHFGYRKMGGHKVIGYEGTWDVRRILGTVDVNEDGSAVFKIPANMPIAIQCLDEKDTMIQGMQSWFTAMPGEIVSCTGCHEDQNGAPLMRRTAAASQVPADIEPWHGPARGFSFKREVQPVLDKYCVGCHDGQKKGRPDLTAKKDYGWGGFDPSYLALHPYVRRPGPESDYHLDNPLEYHVSTSELVQMLRKGHHGVKIDEEGWSRLVMWIDLNVPDHGTWGEHRDIASNYHQRRIEMRTKYAGRSEDPEKIFALNSEPVKFVKPSKVAKAKRSEATCADWPFDSDKARKMQSIAADKTKRVIDLGDGVTMEIAMVPAGKFIMGSNSGPMDERGAGREVIDEAFWMGAFEVTNQQYKQFKQSHDNGFLDQQHKDHNTPGYFVSSDKHPVIRVSWVEAVQFCKWLSEKSGMKFSLPTESQWEWACRAGSGEPFSYGDRESDFSKYANMADISISSLTLRGTDPKPAANPNPYEAFVPRDDRFNDDSIIMSVIGKYSPNAWGLHDMHGNVAEWTLSNYSPYPYSDDDGRNGMDQKLDKVARGGSWRDRPKRCTSSFRFVYRPYQKVYNVGFRVITDGKAESSKQVVLKD